MMNIFQASYQERLQAWRDLRENLILLSLQEQCIEIDKWWQKAPQVNHYLHPDLIDEWPNPWELLHDNEYCAYARGLGMIYTFLFLGITDLAFYEAIDHNDNEVMLLYVGSVKYVLNYWPDTVVNNSLSDFKIIRSLDISPLQNKTG